MDLFEQLDAPVFSRFVFCLRQREALKLAAVASSWTDLVAVHFRRLHISPTTPMSAASAAVDSFQQLREVVVDGERFKGSSFWDAASALLQRLMEKPLEKLTLRAVPLGDTTDYSRSQTDLGLTAAEPGCAWLDVSAEEFLRRMLRKLPSCSSLQHVCFHDVQIDEEEWASQWFAQAFQQFSSEAPLTELVFNGCNLGKTVQGVAGLLALGEGSIFERLQILDLSSNLLGEEGAAHLAAILPKFRALQSLRLAGNGMGPRGVQALVPGLQAVSGELKELDMSMNGLCADGVAALVPASLRLQKLCLSGSWIAPEGVSSLLDLIRPMALELTHLNLASNKLSVDGTQALLEQLPLMPQLRCLNLAENYFGAGPFVNDPFRNLTQCAPLLEELDLKANSLGSEVFTLFGIVAALPPTLISLHLGVAQLSAPRLEAMIQALPNLKKLEFLSLLQARIDDAASEVLASQAFADKLPSLRCLDIRGNAITAPALKRLSTALHRLAAFKQVKTTGREHLLSVKRR